MECAGAVVESEQGTACEPVESGTDEWKCIYLGMDELKSYDKCQCDGSPYGVGQPAARPEEDQEGPDQLELLLHTEGPEVVWP